MPIIRLCLILGLSYSCLASAYTVVFAADSPKLTDAQRIELLEANVKAERAKAAASDAFAKLLQRIMMDPEVAAANTDRDRAVAAAHQKFEDLSKAVCGERKLLDSGQCEPSKVDAQ